MAQLAGGSKVNGAFNTNSNTVDDGNGNSVWAGSLQVNGQFLMNNAVMKVVTANDLNIIPASGHRAGFTNSADNQWLLSANDSTGGAYTKSNTLDDGSGNMTVTGSLNVIGKIANAAGSSITSSSLTVPAAPTVALGTGAVGSNLVASTTYYYAISAVAPDGTETPIGGTTSITESATAVPINVSWGSVTYAVSYKVYKATSTSVMYLATVGGTSYSDTGNVATSSTAPQTINQTGAITANGVLRANYRFLLPVGTNLY